MTSREVVDPVYIERVAQRIHRSGLGQPVCVGLEAGRPLAFVGGQLLWMAQPIFGLVGKDEMIRMIALLLEDPDALDKLLEHLNQE